MCNQISSDKPVSLKEEDRFQRYDFSKRIAERIINAENNDSIVIGVYGAWGEGKTSVINFIENELVKNNSIITIKFNPWRFTDESTLLITFFNCLAREIKKSFNEKYRNLTKPNLINRIRLKWEEKKAPLVTNKEKIGELIEKYGSIVSGYNAGAGVANIGKSMSSVSIDTLKERFESLLIKSNKKIVVFIDDIDRLDKQEIHSIFRLVKLTANFQNTYYILSFDQEMVASAIGERFGSGDKNSGLNFLEKIIQVPLTIPVSQPDSLKQYCFELIEKTIESNKVMLTTDEVRRFVSEFSENVLIKLKTPRLAVQYNNSLSFSLPLLKGEVNIVDLMLVEALKIFYPTYYQFLKINSSYFLNSYSSQTLKFSLTDRSPEVRKKELEEHFERLEKTLSKNEGICVKSLLINLFPRLNEAFKNRFIQNGETEWYKNKRIVSPSYFNRYFSYSVPKGEISDVLFEDFISKIIDYSTDEIKENIFSFIQSSSVDNFLSKLRSREDEYDWNTSVKLAKSISLLGDSFPENRSFFGIDSPKSQAAIFIYQVIKKHNIELESFNLAVELMNIAQPFEFAYEINNWLRTGETEKDKIFVVSQYQELAKALIDRSLNESGETPIYIKFDKNITYLLPVWKEIDCDGFNEYITKTLSANPKNVVDLLRAFTPIVFASNSPEPYKTNFSKEQYHFFNSIFDKNMINKLIIELFSEELYKEKARFPDLKNEQTDINIVRQYKHWYDKENEDNNTSDN